MTSKKWLCALAAVCLTSPAAADEYDTLKFVLGSSRTFDANVFRLPTSSGPPPGFATKSDHIDAFTLGLRIDKPYAQQTFQLSTTDIYTRYDNFSSLSYHALDYRGAWLWHLSPRVSGTLSAERTQSLISFADIRGFRPNLRTSDSYIFNMDGWVSGGWHLLAGVSQDNTKNTSIFLAQPSSQIVTGEFGLKYVATSDSSLALVRRSSDGEYDFQPDRLTFIDNRFRVNEIELQANWIPSGHSTLSGRINWRDQHYEHFDQRDFSGLGGQINYGWTPTAKLKVNVTASRTIAPWIDLGSFTANSNYRVDNALSIAPTWQVAAKTALRARFDRVTTEFLGPVFLDPRPFRRDGFSSALVAVDWSPLRSLTFSASLQRDWRASNNPAFQFGDTLGTQRLTALLIALSLPSLSGSAATPVGNITVTLMAYLHTVQDHPIVQSPQIRNVCRRP